MCFSLAGATKYAIWPKMSLRSSGIDFDSILAAFGVPGGRQNEAKSVPRADRKKHRFSRPFFFGFGLIWGAQGGGVKNCFGCFSAPFSVLELSFLIGHHFGPFSWILMVWEPSFIDF